MPSVFSLRILTVFVLVHALRCLALQQPMPHLFYALTKPPAIESSSTTRLPPPIVLIHGLDSSSATWKDVIPRLASDRYILAMDCRGCGDSPDLTEQDFSLEQLVQDVRCTVQSALPSNNNNNNNNSSPQKLVLLGHSMGARIALAYAATYPDQVECLIMEDMDISRRPVETAPIVVPVTGIPFTRRFDRLSDARQALLAAGYPPDRIDEWIEQGRIQPIRKDHDDDDDFYWWSAINPDFRRLCYQQVFETDSGERDWRRIATGSAFPVHVLVAEQTVCNPASLQRMQQALSTRCNVHHFANTTHSIHSSDLDRFVQVIHQILM